MSVRFQFKFLNNVFFKINGAQEFNTIRSVLWTNYMISALSVSSRLGAVKFVR